MTKFSPAFSFTQMTLDRASSQRKSKEWIQEQLAHPECEIIPIWQGKYLFKEKSLVSLSGEAKFKILNQSYKLINKQQSLVFLGLENTSPIFVVDISSLPETSLTDFVEEDSIEEDFIEQGVIELIDLRAALSIITDEKASMLGYASSLTHWYRFNRFCGVCGDKTLAANGGHSLKCVNEHCHKEFFPRTDAVVIMLVVYQSENGIEKCLLAEHQRMAGKVVSTLAGFVDPAETLEQAVIREVKEEAGVNVFDVEYIASQPWPFPSSLMLGFYAKTNDPSIFIDDEEIRDAKWFTAAQIRQFDEWGDEGDNYKLPRRQSIARFLIDNWLETQK